jgi:lipid-A-disaccharide synthase-like uncharacterized protein
VTLTDMTLLDEVWLGIGFSGQTLFALRFIVQWLYSERHKQSLIPIYFWHFSIAGGLVLLAYAIHLRDPVFILGQSTGVFIYLRNLYFIRAHRTGDPVAVE